MLTPDELWTRVAMLLACGSLGVVLLVVRRRFDVLDPMASFPLLYVLASAGPFIYYLVYDRVPALLEIHQAENVLQLEMSAAIGFVLGAAVMSFRAPWIPFRARTASLDVGSSLPDVRLIALTIFIVAMVLQMATIIFYSDVLFSSSKGVLQRSQSALARITATGAGLRNISFTILAYCAIVARPRSRKWDVIGCALVWVAVDILRNDRSFLLMFVTLVIAYWAVRPSYKKLIAGVVAAVVCFAGIGLARRAGTLDPDAQVEAVLARDSDAVAEILLAGSTNSQMLSLTPGLVRGDYQYGMTYVGSVLNLVPAFMVGGTVVDTASIWFLKKYDPNNPRTPYSFAMDAEAYLNFGPFGPFLVFFVWGMLLEKLYLRFRHRPDRMYSACLFMLLFPASMYAIRSYSLFLIKPAVYLLLILAVARSIKLTRRRVEPSAAGARQLAFAGRRRGGATARAR